MHDSSSVHLDMAMHSMEMDHMDGMVMDVTIDDMATGDMAMHTMTMPEVGMHDMVMDRMEVPSSPSTANEYALVDKFEQPIESCAHCLSHSGVPNAPVSFVGVPDQSKEDVGLVPLPASHFLARPPLTVAQSGPPRAHAPPGMRVPRYVLMSVFLI